MTTHILFCNCTAEITEAEAGHENNYRSPSAKRRRCHYCPVCGAGSAADFHAASFQTAKTELTGYLNDRIVRLNYQDVYYFESNENRVFAYYQEDVYEIRYKLYELEELFAPLDFVRCSKSMIVNMEKIEYLSPLFSGKLEAHLKNGEKIVISRQYVRNLKEKLGIQEVD